MAMLHTINKSPFERNSLDACLRLAKPGSAVLLIEDGIYAATKGTTVSEKVTKAMDDIKFFVLGPDVKARGISDDHMLDGVQVVDYDGFVDLVAEHDNVQSWL